MDYTTEKASAVTQAVADATKSVQAGSFEALHLVKSCLWFLFSDPCYLAAGHLQLKLVVLRGGDRTGHTRLLLVDMRLRVNFDLTDKTLCGCTGDRCKHQCGRKSGRAEGTLLHLACTALLPPCNLSSH